MQDGSLNNTRENLKKTEKKDEENVELTDTEKAMDTSHVPLEAGGTPRDQDIGKERVVLKDQSQHHHDSQLKTSELKADVETVFWQNESDSQSHLEPGVTVKKKRKSKKRKPNSHDVGEEVAHEFQLILDESDGENQTDSCEAAMKQKCFEATSGVGSTQTSTDIKALSQSCAGYKPEMASLVESTVEAGQAECGVSLTQEKTKKKNKKKKMNVGEGKMDTQTNGQIVEKPPEEISLHGHLKRRRSLHGHLETTETEVDKIKSQGGDPGHLEASAMVRKKTRKSKKLCSSLQEFGEEVAVQALPKEHNSGDEMRKLSTAQEVDEDNQATQSQLGTSTTQKKVKRKKLKSSLQEVQVAVKPPATLEDIDEISRHPCPTSEEDIITQCRLKASTTKKKKGNSKKLMSSSQEVGKEVHATPQDSCAEVVATDIPTPAAAAVEVASAEAQPSETLMVRTKKRKTMKAREETGSKLQEELNVKEPEVSSDLAHITTHENKDAAAECSQPKLVKKAKKKKQVSSKEEESTLETKKQPAVEAAPTKPTPQKKEKFQKKQSQPAEEAKEKPFLKKTVKEKTGTEVPGTVPSDDICTPRSKSLTPVKRGKKKRRLQLDEAETSQSNGHAKEEMGGKKVKNSVSLFY